VNGLPGISSQGLNEKEDQLLAKAPPEWFLGAARLQGLQMPRKRDCDRR